MHIHLNLDGAFLLQLRRPSEVIKMFAQKKQRRTIFRLIKRMTGPFELLINLVLHRFNFYEYLINS